eukprot:CAMPEP_0178422620 /NCGR_PEP_ID=MMETSP0689_2-20121128/27268_1 /TAXON_ID=160604 /ORGANISM="Amphidinium massartii, Strain CS-259" /LENGTH=329 /DNA_ID=CAMNT_0020044191 /DNA_START=44 /DNA_END=1033 /DNA_ORIENTATION=-
MWRDHSAPAMSHTASHPRVRRETPVVLHVYTIGADHVAKAMGEVAMAVHRGAFHSGIELYGNEWSYGAAPEGSSGVYRYFPKCSSPEHVYRESITLGSTALSPREVLELLRDMSKEWAGSDYNLIRHNCCNFCDALSSRLGLGGIPAWVNSLATSAAVFDDMARDAEQVLARNSARFGDDFFKALFSRASDARSPTAAVDPSSPAVASRSKSRETPPLPRGGSFKLKGLWPPQALSLWSRPLGSLHQQTPLQQSPNGLSKRKPTLKVLWDDNAGNLRGSIEATARDWKERADEIDRHLKMCLHKPSEEEELCFAQPDFEVGSAVSSERE